MNSDHFTMNCICIAALVRIQYVDKVLYYKVTLMIVMQ